MTAAWSAIGACATVALSAPIRCVPLPKCRTSCAVIGRQRQCIQRMLFHARADAARAAGRATAEPDRPARRPTRPRMTGRRRSHGANDANGRGACWRGSGRVAGAVPTHSGPVCKIGNPPGMAATSRQRARKVPATVSRTKIGKSRTAVHGAIAASADQPRRALIWIKPTLIPLRATPRCRVIARASRT